MRFKNFCAPLAIFLVSVSACFSYADEKPFYLTLNPPPAPELEPAEAIASFTLAPGYEVSLVAAEPLVEDPVVIRWDEHGNLYAVEMRGFMPDAYGNGEDEPVGSVIRLRDTDQDGSYDQREVLLDGLVLPRAIAVVNEGLLIGEPPNLWLCPSPTGRSADINCADKILLGSYGDQPGSVEHAENGLLMGLDNWLYNAKSSRRMRIVDGELQVESTLFRGQWGIAQDRAGRLFYNTNSDLLLGDAYDAQFVVNAGNRRAPGLGEKISTNDQLFAVRVNPGVNRAYVPGVLQADGRLNRPTSASGMVIDRGGWQADAERAQAFVAEPAANAVVQLELQYDGLKIGSEHLLYPNEEWGEVEFFASTDERFRPVDVQIGPDGALYVVDMYRGIIQDHVFLTEQLRAQALERNLDQPVGRGRIWRIAPAFSGNASSSSDLAELSDEALVQVLSDANGWRRDTAQRLLLGRDSRKIKRKLASVVESGGGINATHALWTLSGRGELSRKVLRQALSRPEPVLRRAALLAGQDLLRVADLLTIVRAEDKPDVHIEALLGLTPHNADMQVQKLLLDTLVGQVGDRYIPNAVKVAVQGQEVLFLDALLESNRWLETHEQQSSFVQQLIVQGFGHNPSQAQAILDRVVALSPSQDWLAIALLDGLAEVTRNDGFERAVLPLPHPVFASSNENIWPALTRARGAVTWENDELAADVKPLGPLDQQRRQLGRDYYLARCATCHGADGTGIASLAPPLVNSEWVTGSTERLAQIILGGLQGPISVQGAEWNGVMPGHEGIPEFTDEVGAGLLTFLHRAWGHTGRAVQPEFVTRMRATYAQRGSLWTADDLDALPVNTHYTKYVGRYGGTGFGFEFGYDGGSLIVKSAIFNGPLVEQKEDFFFFEPRELKLEFVYTDEGEVRGVRMLTEGGGVVMPRQASASAKSSAPVK